MPSTITHACIGIDTIKRLDINPKKIINKHINNYKIYCQGMDVLYFYHILILKGNIIQELGHNFHNYNIFNYFERLINDNKENQNEELFTFIAGLISHYQADSIMHPYIDYLAHNENRKKQIDKHFEIETYLDNYYIEKLINKNYQKYNNSQFIFQYTKEKIIEEEINKIFNQYFQYPKMGKKYYQALNEMKFVYKYIRHDYTGIKKKIYQFIDLIPFNIRKTSYLSYHFNLDNNDYYLNLKHQEWFNYHDINNVQHKSFLELYDEVTKKSADIINELYKYIFEKKKVDLKKIVGNNSYSTGLPIN